MARRKTFPRANISRVCFAQDVSPAGQAGYFRFRVRGSISFSISFSLARLLSHVACRRASRVRGRGYQTPLRMLFFNVNELIPKSVRRKIRRRGAGSGRSAAPRDAIMYCFTDSRLAAAYAGEKIPEREK